MQGKAANMTKVPSPCIGVCTFRREGPCIGCSMTRDQKSLFKKLKTPKHQAAFVTMLTHPQTELGTCRHWEPA